MWSTTLANWKENLNKIALDVHDDDDEDEELSIYNNRQDSDRRISHSFARSPSVSNSPVANGFDSPSNSEVNYKVHLLFFFQASDYLTLSACLVQIMFVPEILNY